ncbi:methyl-accepting chemotaxis protein [Desulfospira joergensenii]|uniref:methyl-accepting chemotaxis protein n=1 Tax=Desulfospira joergensenii TaxID=53329 RepID=UPI0003B6E063|nr:methyl-accepting chemotaxis protein [Desulfospira joergensenii]
MGKVGFGKKLYISSIGIILLTIIIIAAVNFYQTKTTFLAKGKAGIQSVSDVLLKTVEIQHNLQKNKLDSDLGMLFTESSSSGKASVVQSQEVDMEIFDFKTKDKSKVTIPKLIFGLSFVTGEYELVDKVGKFSDSEIMFFQLFEEKLIKVSTNVKNQDETRPIGGFYSSDTKQYKSIVAEKPISFLSGSGRDKTLYGLSPFRDELEDVMAGAFGISRKILTQNLEGMVKKVNVNGNGYSFICDGDGKILTHPDPAYAKLNVKDFKGGKNILTTKTGFISYEHENQTYYGFVNYFKPWDMYFTVAVSEAELMSGINKQILTSSGLSGIIALAIGILIIGIMNRQLMKNMNGMATLAKEVAKGNFKHSFTYEAKDAIHDTVDSMNEMVEGLADMIRNLNSGVDTLSSASGELNHISEQMSTGAETSVSKVNTVASAAEEMSVNMDSVAAAMEEASTNVETVAEGTNQMKKNLEQVAQNSNDTREITSAAVEQAGQTSERVQQLGKAAEEINKVTDTITNISSQINLLALNATIEAARAGEAGKGFAVVATEIKDLASQTAGATEDITRNIQEIQAQIGGAVTEIQNISGIIDKINSFVNESAEAIEAQSSTTSEIAVNINQVSQGIQEVNENVAQSSSVSSQVATEISDVLEASQQINEFSSQVKEKAETLAQVMNQLRAMTEKFQI